MEIESLRYDLAVREAITARTLFSQHCRKAPEIIDNERFSPPDGYTGHKGAKAVFFISMFIDDARAARACDKYMYTSGVKISHFLMI